MDRPSKDKLTAVRLETGDYAKLERIAVALDNSVAWCIRSAIRTFIASNAKLLGKQSK
jgi:predicted transcriptional regulator